MAQDTITVETNPQVIEGLELALVHIVSYGSKLGYSISAYPGQRDGVSKAAYELFVKILEAKSIPLDSPEAETAYTAYLRSWRQ